MGSPQRGVSLALAVGAPVVLGVLAISLALPKRRSIQKPPAIGTRLPPPLLRARLVASARLSTDPSHDVGVVDVETTALVDEPVELDAGVPGRVLRAYGDYLGCVVEAGHHEVRFRFEPDSLRRGAFVSALALALVWTGLRFTRD